jgi:mono/diheme cytochrome c family protein
MRIEVFLDDAEQPFEIVEAPNKFRFDSSTISDGKHTLRFRAVDNEDIVSEKVVPFMVQNGPEIAVHGIKPGATVSGRFSVLTNAYSAKVGDEFEPHRIETPAPIPTWAWVLFLVVISWGAGYLSQELHQHVDPQYYPKAVKAKPSVKPPTESVAVAPKADVSDEAMPSEVSDATSSAVADGWQKLGDQVYGNNCSACHQAAGTGLPGVFPSLVSNAVVLDDDPSEHIGTIIHGLSGKAIDGVDYASPMPAFAAMLSDEEIAAVVNHERTEWGNSARLVSAADVASIRAAQ